MNTSSIPAYRKTFQLRTSMARRCVDLLECYIVWATLRIYFSCWRVRRAQTHDMALACTVDSFEERLLWTCW